MPGDALWALAACLLIEAFFAPVARIICVCRYHIQFRRQFSEDTSSTRTSDQNPQPASIQTKI